MKKILILITILLSITMIICACNPNDVKPDGEVENLENNADTENQGENLFNETEKIVVNIAALKGPTGMGLVKLMNDSETDVNSRFVYDFTLEASADLITPAFIKGEIDMAAVPPNIASVLYNNTDGEIVVLDIHTLGVLFIVENGNSVVSVRDLKGKTIYSAGKGQVPEYALNYMLTSNGLIPGKDVMIEFKSEHSECVNAILTEINAVAMLPQPFATTAQMSNENIKIALDLTKEWEQAAEKTLITGVMAARRDFVENNPEAVADFLTKYEASINYVNQNITEAAALIEKFGIVKADVAERAIPFCGISFISGEDMKIKLSEYLTVLYSQNPAAVGGKLPADDFYYIP